MTNAMKFTATLEPAPEGGFTAQCVEVPGAISQGETEAEALDNVADAIALILETRRNQAQRRRLQTAVVEVDA